MLDQMSRDWWIVALQGVAAIAFGILALVWPAITLLALVFLFAAYALVDGVLALMSGIRRGRDGGRPDWWRIARGVVGIAVGVVAFAMPGITAYVLLILIAARAIVSGAIELVAAYQLRDVIRGEWLLALDGVVAIVFGIVLIALPGAGALAVVWLIGGFAIVSGVILLGLAMRLRDRARRPGASAAWESPRSTG
jgi:uncharacterized membrane protein HdeD (DUF308 family)